MGKTFYLKLAGQNLKKNSKFYIPYFIASSMTTAMFYIMGFLADNQGVANMKGHQSLVAMMKMGTFIIGIFAVLILLYINSFLMKRRQKEIGLYNVLGMEKRHIGRILGWETVYSYLISMLCGVGGGILLSKLFLLFLCKLTGISNAINFTVSLTSLTQTLLLFAAIFIFILILNRFKVHLSNPVELLRGGNVGEKEPKANWVLAVLGFALTGTGYYIALTTESPIAALQYFFLAVILVIIGTYFLFIAGTVALLKLLKKNKKFYYKVNHFTAVSGLLYRMKQNAAGLATICILASMVMVMVSTTSSLNIGMNNILTTQYPHDFSISMDNPEKDSGKMLKDLVSTAVAQKKLSISDLHGARYFSAVAKRNDSSYSLGSTDEKDMTGMTTFAFLSADEYKAATGKTVSLGDGEAAAYTYYGTLPESFTYLGQQLKVKSRLQSPPLDTDMSAYLVDSHIIVVKDDAVLETLHQAQVKAQGQDDASRYMYSLYFNTSGTDEQKIALTDTIQKTISNEVKSWTNGGGYRISSSAGMKDDLQDTYGSLLFLGLFLTILFLMATVLIIYYKQISEGYDDVGRYEIMQKVGMSHAIVKKSIHSQILIVFFLPLAVAVLHMAAVFKFMTKLLKLMGLLNIPLFALCTVCTVALFAVIYTIVYCITTRTYYKIVSPTK